MVGGVRHCVWGGDDWRRRIMCVKCLEALIFLEVSGNVCGVVGGVW